jgi:hypothetical protein
MLNLADLFPSFAARGKAPCRLLLKEGIVRGGGRIRKLFEPSPEVRLNQDICGLM